MPKGETLTNKQKRFIDEYLVDMNATQACIRAGYEEKWANQNAIQVMRAPLVVAAIKAALAERAETSRVTKDWLEARALQALDNADKDGEHPSVARNIEFLAKLNGHLIERRETRQIKDWADFTEEELQMLAAARERRRQEEEGKDVKH